MKKIAFICVHNSCRSQMAEAICKKLANDTFDVYSAGSEITKGINKDAVRIIKKIYDIDMEKTQKPKLLNDIPDIDILITMGCNVSCPSISCTYKYDWGLDDPSGKNDDEFEKIINIIEKNVISLREKHK